MKDTLLNELGRRVVREIILETHDTKGIIKIRYATSYQEICRSNKGH